MAATGLMSTVTPETSITIPEPTPRALASSLKMALDNLDRIETMSTAARLNAISRLRPEEITNQYVRQLTTT